MTRLAMTLMWRVGSGAALIIAAVVSLSAQQPPLFKSGVQTVSVFATVTDQNGRLIPELAKEDFEILDNNKPQTVTLFGNELQFIKVVVMLDESGSMVNNIERVKEGAEQFLLRLLPDDRARIGSFEDKMIVSPEFTSDRSELISFLKDKLQYGNGTRLWDAVDYSMTALSPLDGRRVVLVFTDGGDDPGPGKHVSYGTVLKRAQAEGYMVYAIGFHSRCRCGANGRMVETDPDPSLKKIAAESGGGYFELKEGADLASTFTRVAEELHTQYVIGFTPEVMDGKLHTLQVRVKRPGMSARTRKSYVASPDK
jgi:Ca-activated chloride channel homolog